MTIEDKIKAAKIALVAQFYKSKFASQSNHVVFDARTLMDNLLADTTLDEQQKERALEVIVIGALTVAVMIHQGKYKDNPSLEFVSIEANSPFYKKAYYPLTDNDVYKQLKTDDVFTQAQKEDYLYNFNQKSLNLFVLEVGYQIVHKKLPFEKETMDFIFPELTEVFASIETHRQYAQPNSKYAEKCEFLENFKKDILLFQNEHVFRIVETFDEALNACNAKLTDSDSKKHFIQVLNQVKRATLSHVNANQEHSFGNATFFAKCVLDAAKQVGLNHVTPVDVKKFEDSTKFLRKHPVYNALIGAFIGALAALATAAVLVATAGVPLVPTVIVGAAVISGAVTGFGSFWHTRANDPVRQIRDALNAEKVSPGL